MRTHPGTWILGVLCLSLTLCHAQKENFTSTARGATRASSETSSDATASQANKTTQSIQTLKDTKQQLDELKKDLEGEDPDFGVMVGVGSQVLNTQNTDYLNQSNVLVTSSLGRETPQILTGVAFRTHIPNFFSRYQCHRIKDENESASHDESKPYNPWKNCTNSDFLKHAEAWQRRPWGAFVSLKFAPGASQTLNGFVLGGSYAFAKYINALMGFTLTPINVPSPGLRTTAAQFVSNEQKQGRLLNFNPQAMLANSPNAFDGFPLTDATGKLIYPGNALTLNYRAGIVLGISIPIYFKSIF